MGDPLAEELQGVQYWYDGDRDIVKSQVHGVITYFPNRYHEKQADGITEKVFKYYFARKQLHFHAGK